MKKVLTMFLIILFCVSAFSGCDSVLSQNGDSQTTDDTLNTNVECEHAEAVENGEKYANGIRIYDSFHPDDSERNPHFSVTLPTLNNATVKYREDSKIYIDGEYLLGGSGNGCDSFYLSDLTGDGLPELCFCMNLGSGIVTRRVEIIDYTTKTIIFTLPGSVLHDYYLFLRNGILCVKETEYRKQDAIRTGVLKYNGTEFLVEWDAEVNATFDRDSVSAPGEPIS